MSYDGSSENHPLFPPHRPLEIDVVVACHVLSGAEFRILRRAQVCSDVVRGVVVDGRQPCLVVAVGDEDEEWKMNVVMTVACAVVEDRSNHRSVAAAASYSPLDINQDFAEESINNDGR